MEYKFVSDSWGAAFSFPWAAAAPFIKECSEIQLKVLICALAGARYTTSAVLADAAGCSEADAMAAVNYWLERGVFSAEGVREEVHRFSGKNEPVSLVESVKPTQAAAVEKKVTVRYSQREMSEKAEKDATLKNLINEIQSLQFSINGTEFAKIIELYEYYKFDAPSILLAADYCRSAGKCSVAYLYTIMVNWYKEGINTYADVEEAMIKAAEVKSFENKIMRIFGMENKPSKKQREYIREWSKLGYNTELIEIAYNKCMDIKTKLSFSYIDGILKNWANGGITTSEQVAENDEQFKSKRAASAELSGASYDLDEFENFALNYGFGDQVRSGGRGE